MVLPVPHPNDIRSYTILSHVISNMSFVHKFWYINSILHDHVINFEFTFVKSNLHNFDISCDSSGFFCDFRGFAKIHLNQEGKKICVSVCVSVCLCVCLCVYVCVCKWNSYIDILHAYAIWRIYVHVLFSSLIWMP